MPTVVTFVPAAVVGKDGSGNDILGLDKTNTSETTAIITGTGFTSQLAVNVTWGSISWSGSLTVNSGSTEGSVALTCTNSPGPRRLGEPEDVTVTVGNSLGVPFNVPVGTTEA